MSYFAEYLCFDPRSPGEIKGHRSEAAYDSCLSMNIMNSMNRQNLKPHPQRT